MAQEIRSQHECKFQAEKKYYTEYKWILSDWSILYDSTYKNGIQSGDFELNGTNGCVCTLFLDPTQDQPLIMKFSDTLKMLAVKITYSIEGFDSCEFYRNQSIPKTFGLAFHGSLLKGSSKYMFRQSSCEDDTVTIIVQIMIVNSIAITKTPKKTAINCKKLPCDGDSPSKNVLSNFKDLFDRKTLCDVTFLLRDKTFSAHKAMLAAHSKVFEAMFVSDLNEHEENTFDVIDTETEVFERFLNYLYGEEIELEGVAEEMMVLADYYQICDLKTTCELRMLEYLCEENVARYIIIADKFSCTTLKDNALSLLRSSHTALEEALVKENLETVTSLKEILLNNPLKR